MTRLRFGTMTLTALAALALLGGCASDGAYRTVALHGPRSTYYGGTGAPPWTAGSDPFQDRSGYPTRSGA